MSRNLALPSFQCGPTCAHKECQSISPLGYVGQFPNCTCIGQENSTQNFLENVLAIAETLAKIMKHCGIHECKSKSTVDIITYAFMHYDQVCYCLDSAPTKRLRKEEIYHELGRKCLMSREEAHLAYTIMRRGFKAFYYMSDGNHCDQDPVYAQQCAYKHAAKRTLEALARHVGLPAEDLDDYDAKIKGEYKLFYQRMQKRAAKTAETDCHCCFCTRTRGHLIFGKHPPCEDETRGKLGEHVCPYCCQLKPKLIHGARLVQKCPRCQRSRKFCTCEKYEFDLDWVKSIWHRPDMSEYYAENIMAERRQGKVDPCSEWFDPSHLVTMTGRAIPTEAACEDWFDPDFLKHLSPKQKSVAPTSNKAEPNEPVVPKEPAVPEEPAVPSTTEQQSAEN